MRFNILHENETHDVWLVWTQNKIILFCETYLQYVILLYV